MDQLNNQLITRPLQPSIAVRHSSVSIRPFLSSNPNFGLTAQGMVIADGCKHRDQVACLTRDALDPIKTYVTGLNEDTLEMKELKLAAESDPDKKELYEARVKEIRTIVAKAERELTGNYEVSLENVMGKDFWGNVKTFRSVIPDTFDHKGVRVLTYWDGIDIDLDNHGFVLDERNIRDVLLIKIAEAGGFPLVAPSYDIAANSNKFKWYLDKKTTTSTAKTSGRKIRDAAGAELLKLSKGDYNKLFYVSKMISMDSLYYKCGGNATPVDVLYEDCSKTIDGEGSIKSREEASQKFLEYCKMDMEELRLRCMIQDGTQMRYLSFKPDGSIYYLRTNTPMGKTVDECILFLKDPLSQTVYMGLKEQVEKDWTS